MKDGTAAVHVQVPVEVTSFLLNEKRTEIAKIELKQRCNVIMVPNKTLETPHYRLERLKHDDRAWTTCRSATTWPRNSRTRRRSRAAPTSAPTSRSLRSRACCPMHPRQCPCR